MIQLRDFSENGSTIFQVREFLSILFLELNKSVPNVLFILFFACFVIEAVIQVLIKNAVVCLSSLWERKSQVNILQTVTHGNLKIMRRI